MLTIATSDLDDDDIDEVDDQQEGDVNLSIPKVRPVLTETEIALFQTLLRGCIKATRSTGAWQVVDMDKMASIWSIGIFPKTPALLECFQRIC